MASAVRKKSLILDVYLKFRFPKKRMLVSAAIQIYDYEKCLE